MNFFRINQLPKNTLEVLDETDILFEEHYKYFSEKWHLARKDLSLFIITDKENAIKKIDEIFESGHNVFIIPTNLYL